MNEFNRMMPKSTAVIIGAGGGLGSALYKRWRQDHKVDQVIAISRQAVPVDENSREYRDRVTAILNQG